jgi:hypothetical protein
MNRWFKATLDYWESKKTEAQATLETYFQDTVGIGEHSEILEELVKWSERLAAAEDTLETLKNSFGDDGSLNADWVSDKKQLLND